MADKKQSLDVKIGEGMAKAGGWLVTGGKTTWASLKKTVFTFVGGLFMEKKDGEWTVSIGRVAFWMAFAPAVYIWSTSGGLLEEGQALKDISPNHLTTLLALAGYNFGKKVTDTVGNVFGKGDGPG